MICKNCGQLLSDSDEFCFKCGTIFTNEELAVMREPEKTVPLEAIQQNLPRQPEKTVPLEAIQNAPVQTEAPMQNVPRQPEKTVPLEAIQNAPVQTEYPPVSEPVVVNQQPAPVTPMRPSEDALGRISAAETNYTPIQPRTPVVAAAPDGSAVAVKSSNASKFVIGGIAIFVALALVIFGTVGALNGWFTKNKKAHAFLHQNLNEDYTDYLTDHILTEEGLFDTSKPDQNTEGLLSALSNDFDGDGNEDLFTVSVHHGSVNYTYYSNNGNSGTEPTVVNSYSVPIPSNGSYSTVVYNNDHGNNNSNDDTVIIEGDGDEQNDSSIQNGGITPPPTPGPIKPPAFPDDDDEDGEIEETSAEAPSEPSDTSETSESEPQSEEESQTEDGAEETTEPTEPATEAETEQTSQLSVREKNEIKYKEVIDYYDSFGVDKRSVLDLENPTEEDFYNWYKTDDAKKQGVVVIAEYAYDAKTKTVTAADYSNLKDKLGDNATQTSTTQPATQTLDANSQQVQNLLKKVQLGESYKLTLVNYGSVNAATMSNDMKLAAGYDYAKNVMAVELIYPDFNNTDAEYWSQITSEHGGYPVGIPTASVDTAVKTVFGPNVTVEHKDFQYYNFSKYEYFEDYAYLNSQYAECNDEVTNTFHGDGGGGDMPYIYESLYRAEQQGDEIRLYVKYAFVDIEYEENNGSDPFIHHLYSDYDPSLGTDNKGLKNSLGTIENMDYRDFDEYQGDESNNYYWESIYHSTPKPYQPYIDGMHECCYYFTKASDGEYYFSGFELNPTK